MQKIVIILAFLLIVAVTIAITGCEIESASANNVSITPSSVGIREDESVEFTASGGYEYTWSLDEESWGVLSDKTGSKTTYTSRYDPGTNTTAKVQVLTVTSTITGSSGTNSSPYEMTAEAYVEHLPAEEAAPPGEIYITPSEVTLSIGQSQTFSAWGGDEYGWSLKTETYGTLSTRIGERTTYTSLYDPGTNVVVVQELTVTSGVSSFTAYIKHTQ